MSHKFQPSVFEPHLCGICGNTAPAHIGSRPSAPVDGSVRLRAADALAYKCAQRNVSADFARKLETQRDEARAALRGLLERCKYLNDRGDEHDMWQSHELEQAIATAEACLKGEG